jgi:hypothetical protein
MVTSRNKIPPAVEVEIALLKHKVDDLEKKVDLQEKEIQIHHDYMTRFGGIQAAILAIGAVTGTIITWAISFLGKQ